MKNKESTIDISILFLLTIGFFWRAIFENKFLFFSKSLIPAYELLYSLSASEAFPLSVIKGINLSIFYPVNLIVSILINMTKNADLGFRLFEIGFIFHFFLLSAFTYLLLRLGFRLSRYASLFGAIAFAFGGVFVTHILNFPFYFSITWIPLIFLLYLKGLEDNKISFFVYGGLVMGLTVLSYSTYGIFYSSFLILSYFVFEMVFSNQIKISSLISKTLLMLFIGWLIGSAYMLINYFYRGIQVFEPESFISVPNKLFFYIPILSPNSQLISNYWWEISVYLGVPTVIFAVFALFYFKENKYTRFFVFNFIIFTLAFLFLSKEGFFLKQYFKFFPNFEFFNFPTRLRLLSSFSLIVISSFGIDSFNYQENMFKSRPIRYYIVVLIIFVVVCSGIFLPLHYVNEIITLSSSKLVYLNIFSWMLLIGVLNLIVLYLILAKRTKRLLIIILCLLTIDIFTYWSNLNPISYKYGYGWQMKSPSEWGVGKDK